MSSMGNIGFSGIGSGLPIDDIIKATVDAEAVPLKRLEADKKLAQDQISAYGKLSSRLDTLRSAMRDLKGTENFEVLSAASSNEGALTATADHQQGAVNGSYSIEVERTASSYRWVSAALAEDEKFTGSLELEGQTLGPATGEEWTLDDLRAAINDNENLKDTLSASIINQGDGNSRLVINSGQTGETGRLTLDSSSLNLVNAGGVLASDATLTTQPADPLDAEIRIDGITATSATNTFAEVISGVTINLDEGAQQGDVSSLRVSRDDDAIKNRIDAFLMAYNDVIIHINEAKKGALGGEGVLRSIEGQLRDTLYTPSGGDGNLDNTLARMGIGIVVETGWTPDSEASSRNGTLEIQDKDRFNQVLENEFETLAFIFGDPETGYAHRFEQTARSLTDGIVIDGRLNKGLIDTRQRGLNAQIGRIDDRMESMNTRLDALEARLYKQFNSVDSMIANMNNTGDYIMQQMSNLPGYTRDKK